MKNQPLTAASAWCIKRRFRILLKKAFRHLFLLFGCLHLVGGPHSILQVYAWASMIVDYSQESTLSQAVTDTFSGEKPCSMCKKIEQVKESEPDREPIATPTAKLFQDLFPPPHAELKDRFPSPFPHPGFAHPAQSASPPSCGPPSPPPRFLA